MVQERKMVDISAPKKGGGLRSVEGKSKILAKRGYPNVCRQPRLNQ